MLIAVPIYPYSSNRYNALKKRKSRQDPRRVENKQFVTREISRISPSRREEMLQHSGSKL